jgi:hypothetical protein
LEFEAGDIVFLKVSPIWQEGKTKSTMTEGVGLVAYKVSLPLELAQVHNVFHVFTLRKYIYDPIHVVKYKPLQ